MLDLHRHDHGSTFDGFGKPDELVQRALQLGYTALGISNHGNLTTAIKHYRACKDASITPIIGIEGYFIPTYKEKHRGYHLCLFAANLEGYKNINTIQYEGEKRKYYNSIWDLQLLRDHSEGVICTTACVGSYFGQAVKHGNYEKCNRLILALRKIFGDSLYIEIQPYKVTEKNLQEATNVKMMFLAERYNIRTILTSDSHFGSPKDFDTYLKMHEIAGANLDHIKATYYERYMPSESQIIRRFVEMHTRDFGNDPTKAKIYAESMIDNLTELSQKVEPDLFSDLASSLPKYDPEQDSFTLLKSKVKRGLRDLNLMNEEYIDRVKMELDTVKHHSFSDYFLIVQDYANWARSQGIAIGTGRGSCCNYLMNYALGITGVDSIKFDLEPRRFLMKERHKMADVDLDFESERRDEVINYLLEKYKGRAAKICNYGLYKVDNLLNDLAKVCGLPTTGMIDDVSRQTNRIALMEIKTFVKNHMADSNLDLEAIKRDPLYQIYNRAHDDILKHFYKLYDKIRYISTHAAGVIVTNDDILKYTSLKIDAKTGSVYTMYDLKDMESINCIKFDMLGLITISELKECRSLSGVGDFDYSMLEDQKVLEHFRSGNASGVFQFDRHSVQDLLSEVGVESFNDIVACNAMNRPGSLQQKMPQLYAKNKQLAVQGKEIEANYFSKWLGKTFGAVIYQEQIMKMAVDIAGMSWDEAHTITKMELNKPKSAEYFRTKYHAYEQRFVDGCEDLNVPEDIARDTFKKFHAYSFNAGHSTGYSLLSVEQMFYKVYFPEIFWYTKLKYINDKVKAEKYLADCVQDGGLIFLPHVNFSDPDYTLRKVDGVHVIQQGLTSLDNLGLKAAELIANERRIGGRFKSYDDFEKRCKDRSITKRVIIALEDSGALGFNQNQYLKRIKSYNTALYQRGTPKNK